MESNKKPIKKSLIFTIIFVVIVVLLTFFSKTLYNLNLPSVSYTSSTYGSLKRVFNAETIVYAKTEYDLYAPSIQKVLEVTVWEGDYVQKDQILVRLDSRELEDDMLQLELERQQILDRERDYSSKAYELALEAVERRINTKQGKIDESIIVAPADGYITAMTAKVGMTTNTTTPLITVSMVEDGLQVSFDLTQKQATWFAKDDKIMVYIPILNRTFDGFISRIKSAPYGNGMVVMADITDPLGEIPAGQLAEITFTKMSSEYPTIVPLSALRNDGNRDYIFKIETVKGPLGDEYLLYKMYVRVLDQDDTMAALEAETIIIDRLVTESDQALYGGRVKLRR